MPDAGEVAGLDALQERIGVRFRRQELLREAMTHASWNNERGGPSGPGFDNERLEYLGDAVLELVVGEYLFRRFPDYDEGKLTQLRAALVNTISLARLAERLAVGDALLLGKGAVKTGARRLPSLLANAFEAMIGAIFLDQGYRVATRVFIQNIGDLADWTDENHKGRLQEVAQERTGSPPHYRVTAAGGTGHRREYRAEAVVGGEVVGVGTATTKQAAEQSAARQALERLQKGRRKPTATMTQAAGSVPRVGSGESLRARRRIAEVAADATPAEAPAIRRRRRGAEVAAEVNPPTLQVVPVAPAAGPRRRGFLGALARAAEALVGRAPALGPDPPPTTPPVPPPSATDVDSDRDPHATDADTPAAARSRRGRRGGRGRRRSPASGGDGPRPGPAAGSRGGDGRRRPPPAGDGGAGRPG